MASCPVESDPGGTQICEIMKICEKKFGTLSTGILSTENCLFWPKLGQCGGCKEDFIDEA